MSMGFATETPMVKIKSEESQERRTRTVNLVMGNIQDVRLIDRGLVSLREAIKTESNFQNIKLPTGDLQLRIDANSNVEEVLFNDGTLLEGRVLSGGTDGGGG